MTKVKNNDIKNNKNKNWKMSYNKELTNIFIQVYLFKKLVCIYQLDKEYHTIEGF